MVHSIEKSLIITLFIIVQDIFSSKRILKSNVSIWCEFFTTYSLLIRDVLVVRLCQCREGGQLEFRFTAYNLVHLQ